MHRIPTYDELVASDAESSLPSDSEDEDALDEQETFERQYNFRFEEPDGDLVRYSLGAIVHGAIISNADDIIILFFRLSLTLVLYRV